MGIKVKVNERTKTDAPEKPRDEALWILPPSQPDRKFEKPKMKPIRYPARPSPESPKGDVLPWNLPSSPSERPPETISPPIPIESGETLQWNLPPSQPCKPERPKMEPIALPHGPRPIKPECCMPPLTPKEPKKLSPVVNESENELYEKILKALEKDEKRHYTMDLLIEGTEWIEDGEFFYTTIKASEHNVIFPIVKDVFILNEKGNYESTFFSYEVLSNDDIRIISSEPHNYKVYIESEE